MSEPRRFYSQSKRKVHLARGVAGDLATMYCGIGGTIGRQAYETTDAGSCGLCLRAHKRSEQSYYEENKGEILTKQREYEQRPEVKAYRRESSRRYRERNREAVLARAREYEREKKRWRTRDLVKVRARYAVRNAMVAGKLERQPCEVCGEPKTHAHHDDYSKRLDVRWLCPRHHGELHRAA